MDQVIVAFASEKTCLRVREILEHSGTASCLTCRSGDQVRRWVNQLHIAAVVCGYKLAEECAPELLHDLPPFCSMLLVAPQNQLELVGGAHLYPLPAPVSRGALSEAVELLLLVSRAAGQGFARRSQQEQEVIHQAKALLMERCCLTEEEAHRFLQRKSMDRGEKLAQTARLVLEGACGA